MSIHVMDEEIKKALTAVHQVGTDNATAEQKQLASTDWLSQRLTEPLREIRDILKERLPDGNTRKSRRSIAADKGVTGGLGAGIGATLLVLAEKLLGRNIF